MLGYKWTALAKEITLNIAPSENKVKILIREVQFKTLPVGKPVIDGGNRKKNYLFSLPLRFFTFEWNLLTFSLRSGIVLLS